MVKCAMRLFTTLASALVASVLTSVTLLSSPAAADQWSEACEEDGKPPLLHIVTFEIDYSDAGSADETFARLDAVTYAPCIDKVITSAEKWPWRFRHLRQPYMDELKRMQDWLHNDLDKIHELSRFYKARNREPYDALLAALLRNWGLKQKHPPAVFGNLQANFLDSSSSHYAREMTFLAEGGYIPAMKDLARRYFQGDRFNQDKGSAWYWLKRLQQEGIDTFSITSTPLEQVLLEMNSLERMSLAYWAHYYDDLDLTSIKIPAAFSPLSGAVPPPLSDQEIARFKEKFKGLNRHLNKDSYKKVERDLVARTVGIERSEFLSIHGQIRPFGMDNDNFMQRKCIYLRAASEIFPEGRGWEGDMLGLKDLALSSLFEEISGRTVKDALACGASHPNRESENVLVALSWAKEIAEQSPTSLRAIAKSYNQKRDTGPDINDFEGKSEAELRALHERAMYGLLTLTLEEFAAYKEKKIKTH